MKFFFVAKKSIGDSFQANKIKNTSSSGKDGNISSATFVFLSELQNFKFSAPEIKLIEKCFDFIFKILV